MSLAQLFLRHLDQAPAVEPPELEELLAQLLASGHAAWPDVKLEAEQVLPHLATRLSGEADLMAALRGVHSSDFYLACGCTVGDAAALEAFETHFLDHVRHLVGRDEAMRGFTVELQQELRTRLLVADDPGPPKIALYSGRGPLSVWLRVAAVRLAINLRRAARRGEVDQEVALLLERAGDDPEVAYFKSLYGKELDEALRAALTSLTDREANLLRLYFLEGISTEALSAMYQTPLRTIQRQLLETRQKLLDGTHAVLKAQVGLASSQIDSVLTLVGSQLGLDVHDLLKKP
jgi:RNA polymerase sigma-70 factor, ECF subfamily